MARNLKPKEEQLPAVINFAEDASNGLSDLTAQDYAIPYLSILQKTSPQLDTHDVKAGQIWNSVTELAANDMIVIPCAYIRNFVEWVPRDMGGGLVGVHSVNELPKHSRIDGRLTTEGGNMLVETANHYVMIVTKDGVERLSLIHI